MADGGTEAAGGGGAASRTGVTTEKDDVKAGPGESRSAAPGEGGEGEEAPRINTGLFNLPDTIRTLSAMGVSKSKVNPAQGILLGWQATAYLAFGAFLAWAVMFGVTDDLSGGLGKFLGFMMFGVSALVLVILYGSNLVTGDYLTASVSLMTRQARWREVLWEWSITHSGHWVGGFVIGWLIIVGASQAGSFGAPLMEVMAGIGEKKVSGHTWDELFYRAILANWLIAMGVWGAYRTKDIVGKVLLIGIPASIFFAIGFEHSIVNHFALSAGLWAGGDYTWGEAWFKNLVPVTLGNIIGAMFLQGMVHWYASGMQVWVGPGKWKRPHGSYRDLARAFRDSFTLMLFFVAMAPLAVGALFLFVVEPAMGITAGESGRNWIEPIGIFVYLAGTALLVKRFFQPRKWYKVPDE